MFTARLGSNDFQNVMVPILWGSRAIFEGDEPGTFRIIDLAATPARIEINNSTPETGVGFLPRLDGYGIKADGEVVYTFNPVKAILRDPSGALPELEISNESIRVDSGTIQGCSVSNFEVGLLVNADGLALGTPIPESLNNEPISR